MPLLALVLEHRGVGSMIGPALGGIAMRLWDPHGIIVVLALLWLLYLPVPLANYVRRRRSLRA